MVAYADITSRDRRCDDRIPLHGVNRGHAPTEDDPERCAYKALDPKLERQVREQFQAAFDAEAERLGLPSRGTGMRSVSVSVECNSDGDPWLRLLATDSSTWYLGWDGERADAVSSAGNFGEMMGQSLSDP
jgi:hypothetical protein